VQKLLAKPEILRIFVRLHRPMRGGIADYSGNVNNVLRRTFYRCSDTNSRKGRSGIAETAKMGESALNTKSRPQAAFSGK
jgi:hypothetical protein